MATCANTGKPWATEMGGAASGQAAGELGCGSLNGGDSAIVERRLALVDLLMPDDRIILVTTPAQVQMAGAMFREYAASLDFSLEYQGLEAELAGLPGRYGAPGGAFCWRWRPARRLGVWRCGGLGIQPAPGVSAR